MASILHDILHNPVTKTIAQTAKDVEQMVLNAPAGLVYTAKGLVTHPVGTIEQMGRATLQDLQHPLRHPGYTLADVLGLAGGVGGIVGRAGEAARAGAAGESVGRALLTGPKPTPRVIQHGGASVEIGHYAKNPATMQMQKMVDQLHAKFPEANLPPVWKSQASRAGAANVARTTFYRNFGRAEGQKLVRDAKKFSSAQVYAALRVVPEGVPIADRIALHMNQLASGELKKKRMITETRKQIALLEAAKQYVHDVPVEGPNGTTLMIPRLNPDQTALQQLHDNAYALAKKREQILKETSNIGDQALLGRVAGPRATITGEAQTMAPTSINDATPEQIASVPGISKETAARIHAHLQENPVSNIHELKNLPGIGDAKLAALQTVLEPQWMNYIHEMNLFRVPYEFKPGAHGVLGFGTKFSTSSAISRSPGTFRNSFTGGILKGGGGRTDVAKLMAEDYSEAYRYQTLIHMADHIIAQSSDTPVGMKNPVAIRVDALSKGAPTDIAFFKNPPPIETLTESEGQALARSYEAYREAAFPDLNTAFQEYQDAIANGKIPGVRFIEDKALGGLNKPNPLFAMNANIYFRSGLNIVDQINNANRAAILYLKPAYIVPNLLGNFALNLLQQGFAAPRNLVRAAKANAKLGGKATSRIDSLMGEGFAGSLQSANSQIAKIGSATDFLAQKFGSAIDVIPRRASWLYEAGVDGFNTSEKIQNLFDAAEKNPGGAEMEAVRRITERANNAIIDYENLGPFEQAFARRLIFFYPWVKGSYKFAKAFPAEHPIATGVQSQLGEVGTQKNQKFFGALPSYLEGAINVGSRGGNPLILNPNAISILGTPAQLAQSVQQTLSTGKPNLDISLINQGTPALSAIYSLLSGRSPGGYTKPGSSPIALAAQEVGLTQAIPQVLGGGGGSKFPLISLIDRFAGAPQNPNALYPLSTQDAILRYLLGSSVAPAPLDVARANVIAGLQKSGR